MIGQGRAGQTGDNLAYILRRMLDLALAVPSNSTANKCRKGVMKYIQPAASPAFIGGRRALQITYLQEA